jgi:hypothetical protein
LEQEPHLLVRVIAGFALFEAWKLGWDTSLTVVPRPPTDYPSRISFEVPYGELTVFEYEVVRHSKSFVCVPTFVSISLFDSATLAIFPL